MKRIMIVDDDNLFRWGLSSKIPEDCQIPVEILSVDNGSDATREIASCFYDLCFLDVHLPDSNGIDVMEKIKEISPNTKIIIMTADELDNECKKRVEETAYQFLSKPFDFYQVKFILKHALERDGSSNPDVDIENTKDNRKYRRQPFKGMFDYTIKASEAKDTKVLNLKGDIIDMSEGGVGIMTNYSLPAGQLIEIEGLDQKKGLVKWISMIEANRFRLGIEFV